MQHYIRNEDEDLPPIDRFNIGQKYFFWVMLWAGLVLLISGIVLWIPELIPWGVDTRLFVPTNFARPAELRRCLKTLAELDHPDYERTCDALFEAYSALIDGVARSRSSRLR